MSTETKCPFVHKLGSGTANRDWWPNQLPLEVLHQRTPESSPMGEDFNYTEAFKSLDLAVVKKDLEALIVGARPKLTRKRGLCALKSDQVIQ